MPCNRSNDVPFVPEWDARAKVVVPKHLDVDVSREQAEWLVQETSLDLSPTPLDFVRVSINCVVNENDVLGIFGNV